MAELIKRVSGGYEIKSNRGFIREVDLAPCGDTVDFKGDEQAAKDYANKERASFAMLEKAAKVQLYEWTPRAPLK